MAPGARPAGPDAAWLQRYRDRLDAICPAARPHAGLVRLEAAWTAPAHDDDLGAGDAGDAARRLDALAFACEEAQLLAETAQREVLPALAVCGVGGDGDASDAAVLARTRLAAERLRACAAFCARSEEVALAIWELMARLGDRSEHFLAAWSVFANTLGNLVAVDALVQDNETLQHWWTRLLPESCKASGVVDAATVNGQRFATLEKRICTVSSDTPDHHAALQRACKLLVKDLDAEWRAASREDESFPSYECEGKLVGLAALCRLCDRLSGSCDAWRPLRELGRLIPVVSLHGRTAWFLDDFVGDGLAAKSRRKDYTSRLVSSLAQRVPAYAGQVAAWVARVSRPQPERERCIVHALALAFRVRRALIMTLRLHAEEALPMSKHLVSQHVAACIELLVVIRETAERELAHGAEAARCNAEVASSIRADIAQQAAVWMRRLGASENPDPLATAGLAMLARASSGSRFERARVALGAVSSLVSASGSGLCHWEEVVRLERQLERQRLVTRWQTQLDRAGCCPMLVWDVDTLLPLMLRNSSAPRIRLLVSAFASAGSALFGKHAEERSAFRDRLVSLVREHFVNSLCVRVDEALRLQQHAVHMEHLQTTALQVEDLRPAIHIGPLAIMDVTLHPKACVEHYLQRQFYNMTVLALHDWKIYAEMQEIASETLGLEVPDSTLPQGGLDAAVDVLELMRHWVEFVSQYKYNLSQQFFIERRVRRGTKYLRTVTVQTVSSSVGTHGLGILSTCVNFAYQFLTKSISGVSDFLLEEEVKSHLARERRWFALHANDRGVDHKYPFERAFRYNREVRNLSTFRELLTRVGNTLGFVRMVRAAGRRWVADAVQTLHSLEPSEPAADAETLNRTNKLLCEKFDMGKDYLHVLVDVFRRAMGGAADKAHLDNFYMLVPALTINYVESIMSSVEQLSRAHQGREAFFTDDGFAVGVAYVLTILCQADSFSALRWFASLQEAFSRDINELRAAGATLSQEDAARLERLERFRAHYRLVEFAMESSLVFFKLA